MSKFFTVFYFRRAFFDTLTSRRTGRILCFDLFLFAELDFRIFLNDLTNLAPAEPLPEGPRQAAQTQLAEV